MEGSPLDGGWGRTDTTPASGAALRARPDGGWLHGAARQAGAAHAACALALKTAAGRARARRAQAPPSRWNTASGVSTDAVAATLASPLRILAQSASPPSTPR